MAVPLFTKSRYRNILIIAISVLVVAGAAGGTLLVLKRVAPAKTADTSETAPDNTPPLKKAEDLFAKGDYEGAKAQYQNILETYKSQKNEAGAADIEMQLRVIDATAKAPKAPQNTDKGRVVAGSQPQQ